MYSVTKRIDFCYGHRLLDYDGICKHPHGHNALAEVEVRTGTLQAMQASEIDLAVLKAEGVVPRNALGAKVILSGKLERKVALKEIPASKGARAMIEAAGGSIQLTEKPAAPRKEKKAKKAKSEGEAQA